ncbi:hypothetical protein I547_3611 [Mycobacterium kansasii 824]|nr:hypothetical protein I547_3611 [Mycobacterium kansasii 824]
MVIAQDRYRRDCLPRAAPPFDGVVGRGSGRTVCTARAA